MKKLLASLLVMASLAASGCGTFLSFEARPSRMHPYSGIVLDAEALPLVGPLALIDLPLSFVADTAFLPITIAAVLPKP